MKNHKVMICHIIDVASPTNGRETLKKTNKRIYRKNKKRIKSNVKDE